VKESCYSPLYRILMERYISFRTEAAKAGTGVLNLRNKKKKNKFAQWLSVIDNDKLSQQKKQY
jgi:hypothetical protein